MNVGTAVCAGAVLLGCAGFLLEVARRLHVKTRTVQVAGAFVFTLAILLFLAWKLHRL